MSWLVRIVPDDLITTINDFKKTASGQTINVMEKTMRL